MRETESTVLLSTNFWRGIYNWFMRGGIINVPPEGVYPLKKLLERNADYAILSLINDILPYSLLFDEIYLPPMPDMSLSKGLKKDMTQSMGVKEVGNKYLEDFIKTNPKKPEHHLSAILSRNDAMDLIRNLYKIAGPFAADYTDFLPILYSMDAAVYISQIFNARLNCDSMELRILETIARNNMQSSMDERVKVIQHIFQVHNLPILTLDAFRNEKGLVDLDNMFSRMKSLRKSKNIRLFRKKVSEISDLSVKNIRQVIEQELVNDLRITLEEYVLQPIEVVKSITKAIITDMIGMLIPVPTGTLLEGISVTSKMERSASLEWRLFVFEYGDAVINKYKSYRAHE